MMYRGHQGFKLGPIGFIIIASIIVFIGTLFIQGSVSFLGLRPLDLASRPWTMITSIFVHGGPFHLIANMVTLYFFGRYVNQLVGEKWLLIIYFLGGIAGNLFFVLLGNPFATVIGASGAVFALGGVLVIFRPKAQVFVFPIPAPIPLWMAVIGSFVLLTLLFFSTVAWEAHLGGLLLGLGAGYLLEKRGRRYF